MNDKVGFNAQAGYSMIEVLTGVVIFAILALASTNLFFSTTVGSTKDSTIRKVKQNGEFALTQIEQSLRGAVELVDNQEGVLCDNNMRSISFVDVNDQTSEWYVDSSSGRIMYNGEFVTTEDLAVEGDRLVINCEYDPGNDGYFVSVGFRLQRTSLDKQEEAHEEYFETSVQLRN